MPAGHYIRTEETREKIRKIHLGKKHSEKSKRKMSDANRGKKNGFHGKHHSLETRKKWSKIRKDKPTWNKGMKLPALSLLHRLKISDAIKGENHPNWTGGKPHCKTCGKLLTQYTATYCKKCCKLGQKSYTWKGGITPLNHQIRTCFEYRQWRSDVFTRDHFTCQQCGDAIGGNLVAHHKVEFADIIERHEITNFEEAVNCEELWNINNGETLCEDCHIEKHKEIKI